MKPTRNGPAPCPVRQAPLARETLPPVAGVSFFTLTKAECIALYPDLATTPFRDPLARAAVKRMTEAMK